MNIILSFVGHLCAYHEKQALDIYKAENDLLPFTSRKSQEIMNDQGQEEVTGKGPHYNQPIHGSGNIMQIKPQKFATNF